MNNANKFYADSFSPEGVKEALEQIRNFLASSSFSSQIATINAVGDTLGQIATDMAKPNQQLITQATKTMQIISESITLPLNYDIFKTTIFNNSDMIHINQFMNQVTAEIGESKKQFMDQTAKVLQTFSEEMSHFNFKVLETIKEEDSPKETNVTLKDVPSLKAFAKSAPENKKLTVQDILGVISFIFIIFEFFFNLHQDNCTTEIEETRFQIEQQKTDEIIETMVGLQENQERIAVDLELLFAELEKFNQEDPPTDSESAQ